MIKWDLNSRVNYILGNFHIRHPQQEDLTLRYSCIIEPIRGRHPNSCPSWLIISIGDRSTSIIAWKRQFHSDCRIRPAQQPDPPLRYSFIRGPFVDGNDRTRIQSSASLRTNSGTLQIQTAVCFTCNTSGV